MEELVLDGVKVMLDIASYYYKSWYIMQLSAIEDFFSASGSKSLIFYYEETAVPASKDGKYKYDSLDAS